MQKVEVFFEDDTISELVATFEYEELYMAALPILEFQARQRRMKVTERVVGREQLYYNLRVVKANSKDDAIDQVEAGNFLENHDLCDLVLPIEELVMVLDEY